MKEILAVSRALADAHRVRTLQALRRGELCLCQIIALLELAPSTVSRHMTALREAGLVATRKDRHWVHFRLAGTGASPIVRGALRWLDQASRESNELRADARRLDQILSQDKAALCSRYEPALPRGTGRPRKGKRRRS